MDFTVFTSAQTEDVYGGEAYYKLVDGGALQVWPLDDRREIQVVYGPTGWLRIEVLSPPETGT